MSKLIVLTKKDKMFLSRVSRNVILRGAGLFKSCESNAAAFSTSDYSQEKKINVNGQTVNYIRLGSGPHVVLCFPGALGTIWSDFKPQLEGLSQEEFTVVAWDPPGYGNSRPPDRNFGTDFYERDGDVAKALMQELGLAKFSVLGWSDGGISGLIMAAKYPKAVKKLVVWGANSYVIPAEIEAYERMRDLNKWSEKMKAPLIAMYGEEGLTRMWHSWCDTLTEIYKKNDGNICKEVLAKIKCPTFVLHGDKDPMVANEHPEYLIANIGPSKLHRFSEGKHNIHLRYAKEFNELVTNFLTTQHTGK